MQRNHNLNIQDNFIFFDTETDISKNPQTLKLGWGIHWNQDTNQEEKKYFEDGMDFWRWVDEKTERETYVYAHNIDFDFKVTNGYENLSKLNYKLVRFYIDGTTFIMTYRKDRKTLKILDTMNYIPMSLKKIGQQLDKNKEEIDLNTCDKEHLSKYCLNDVEVIKKLMQEMINFLIENDLSKLKPTAASLAFNTYKHRFYDLEEKPIYIHAQKETIALERDSYRGGIVDCLKIGKYTCKLYKLDINSMYPYIMKTYSMPVKLKYSGGYENMGLSIERALKKYHIISRMTFTMPEKYAYILNSAKIGGMEKSLFLKGRQTVTVSTPEIEYILKHGQIDDIHHIALYEKENIFTEYVDYFYDMKVQNDKNPIKRLFAKLMMNSLYGKFGSYRSEYEIVDKNMEYAHESFTIIEEDCEKHYMHIGTTLIEVKKTEENSYDSFVAISSLITAYARMYLVELIEKAGRDNTYYVDTDCLIVNDEGYKNLEGFCDDRELGKLKLEGISVYSEFIKPKYYLFNDELKCKGVKKKHVLIYEDENDMMVEQLHFQRFKTSLKKHELNVQRINTVRKRIRKTYDKGVVINGVVHPYSLAEIKLLTNDKGRSEPSKLMLS